MTKLFGRTRRIAREIDAFLDAVSEAGIVFETGLRAYLTRGASADCAARMDQISELESRGDKLRRSIETSLEVEMLIPDSRGDVLALLDDLDELIDVCKHVFQTFTIEQPEFPEPLAGTVAELVGTVVKAVEATVLASRAFFRDPRAVKDHAHKVSFYEGEADTQSIQLKTDLFGGELPLQNKMHLRDCVDAIDQLANEAQNVSDQLAIYAIKRLV